MNHETEKALRGSIAKWEGIVAGTNVDRGTSNCDLCQLFYEEAGMCDGCPVMEATGKPGCRATPYVTEWLRVGGCNSAADTPARKAAAQAELDFLRSLLPAAPDAENGAKP